MKKVNLLVIGAQKAGTTSLCNYLKQHGDIYFSEVKEVTYFVDDVLYPRGEDYYHSFFPKYGNQEIVAGSYVHMLSCPYCPERVFRYNPEMKFIVILREPVERAYSAFHYACKNGWEDERNTFLQAFELEKGRLLQNFRKTCDLLYFYNGLYFRHLLNWMRFFPKKRFLLVPMPEFINDPQKTLAGIFEFLEVSPQSSLNTSREYNKAGRTRIRTLQRFLLSRNSLLKKYIGLVLTQRQKLFIRSRILPKVYEFNTVWKANAPLSRKDREIIEEYFRDDLRQLEREFGITFGSQTENCGRISA